MRAVTARAPPDTLLAIFRQISERRIMGNSRNDLPRYVGYAEIAESAGIDKRQIQRMMAAGRFPKPDNIPTKENRWRHSVIEEWLKKRNAEQLAALDRLAETDPSKLKPEQLENAALSFLKELAKRRGLEVPDDAWLDVRVHHPESDPTDANWHTADLPKLAAMFRELHQIKSMMLARESDPKLAEIIDPIFALLGIRAVMTADEWRSLSDQMGQALADQNPTSTRAAHIKEPI